MASSPLVPCAIFVSGNGTNMQAVIDATRAGTLPLDIRLVLSNVEVAFALERARRAGIPTSVITWDRARESRAGYAARLARAVRDRSAELVLLLGWMHVLAKEFLEFGFAGVLNLHPAYLPEDPSADTVVFPDGHVSRVFRGPHALADAIDAKAPETGASLIEITPLVDRGRVLARATLVLRPEDDEASALARLHVVEQRVVREGIEQWVATRREAVSAPRRTRE